ncbi:hypothetical protein FNF27_06251 [Cafeteria roenbergensis]|uniref:Uncharacterized protein n=1 Tax=Cafeteria roenbergensis TaxID=33653 RepID=A0A5A8CA13_CAFRO|nr:hypothetical protein FNF29_05572 [Cafeteria roenbergensis]KAA0157973.1 hypothetical protein FNF31_05613 [Cafeteria roenbergensis]KAA0171744.1 hypothetical protein FNF27_06251 [Cafeteria roenbergensis]|eukprot:KAA0149952.1 hypothetical protein FNF29_05572 [Cafeteria roenbergensis]
MAARIATRALRSSPGSVLRVAGAARGGHGPAPLVSGHIEPPFHRMPPTNRELHEENELIWNDGVAPETCLDFDAPHYTSSGGLMMWAGAFFGLFLWYKLFATVDWNTHRKAAARELPESTRAALGDGLLRSEAMEPLQRPN